MYTFLKSGIREKGGVEIPAAHLYQYQSRVTPPCSSLRAITVFYSIRMRLIDRIRASALTLNLRCSHASCEQLNHSRFLAFDPHFHARNVFRNSPYINRTL